MAGKRIIFWGFLSLAIGIAFYAFIYKQLPVNNVKPLPPYAKAGIPQIGGDFILTDQQGRKCDTRDFQRKYRLIYFGYSFCPDICPLGLQNMSGALEALGRDLDEIQPVFVTIDPERDTVEALQVYASHFHSKIKMLTGSLSEIEPVLKNYKVYAVKAKPDGTMADYLMDHSTLIYLMDRNGHFLKSFPHTLPAKDLAKALTLILAQEKIQR